MRSFLARYQSQVKGVLSGFDRIRFRGTIRWLSSLHGMGTWLSTAGVLLKDFRSYATGLTDRIKETSEQVAQAADRPLEYLLSVRWSEGFTTLSVSITMVNQTSTRARMWRQPFARMCCAPSGNSIAALIYANA